MTTTLLNRKSKLKPGPVVRCRTRRYRVEEAEPPVEAGADTVVAMACMGDQAIGQRPTVFLEREIDFEVLGESSWEVVAQRGFDQLKQFSGYLNTVRWNCVTASDAELFQAPYWAGIDVKAYQLEPLRKALQMARVGLFIGDSVGLSKTIEAGLNLREMLLRQRIRELGKLERKAADAEPTGLIPDLADQVDVPALDLSRLSKKEHAQLRSDQRYWERRLETIETELSSEPQRIAISYRAVTHRLEPAGLVYLWPNSG